MSFSPLWYRLELWLGYTRVVQVVTELGAAGQLRWIPPLPRWLKKWHGSEPPPGPKSLDIPPLPQALLSYPGILRDSKAEEEAFKQGPVPAWTSLHPAAVGLIYGGSWSATLPFWPARGRGSVKMLKAPVRKPGALPDETLSPEDLSQAVKNRGAGIGISAIGMAEYDPKYTWAQFVKVPGAAQEEGSRVIVCVLEQNWEATQAIPSTRGERAAYHAYTKLGPMVNELAEYVRSLGYVAQANEGTGRGVSIHYAVEAGLGQLGMNGQLLTPFAGSRCRLMLIHTTAPLALDKPKDYGIPAICDLCKVCVRRCPSGAIPTKREYHRGVYKIKIKTERCVPMLAQAHACGVCMKVCPIQRYGLPAVIEHFEETGAILGRGTDELEGYHWPADGRHYGPGEKPKSAVTNAGLHPRGWDYDKDRPRAAATVSEGKQSFWSRLVRPLREEWSEKKPPDLM